MKFAHAHAVIWKDPTNPERPWFYNIYAEAGVSHLATVGAEKLWQAALNMALIDVDNLRNGIWPGGLKC